MTNLLGGQVKVYFSGAATSIEYIRTGKVRALAVTTTTRWDALPAVSTVGDFLPGYEAHSKATSTFNGGTARSARSELICYP